MTNKIIIADDSASIRRLVKMALSRGGYEVIEAEDGLDGLDKLSQNRDAAMMICDINMPRMNGLELIEAVRREPAHQGLPLLVLTTEGNAERLARARSAGAQGWLVKPFKPDVLLAAVTRLIELSGAKR